MSQIKILCSTNSLEAIALANRLDGELTEHLVCDRGHILCFDFAIPTFGEQFIKAVSLYPEYIEVIAS
jgi:hypothetical protein